MITELIAKRTVITPKKVPVLVVEVPESPVIPLPLSIEKPLEVDDYDWESLLNPTPDVSDGLDIRCTEILSPSEEQSRGPTYQWNGYMGFQELVSPEGPTTSYPMHTLKTQEQNGGTDIC